VELEMEIRSKSTFHKPLRPIRTVHNERKAQLIGNYHDIKELNCACVFGLFIHAVKLVTSQRI
jgi:hypothetical protein